MLNSIDLYGPDFLIFYSVSAALLLSAQFLALTFLENRPFRPWSNDPYAIAYLRGGAEEAIDTAALKLYRERVLSDDGSGLRVARETPVSAPKIERIVCQCFEVSRDVSELRNSKVLSQVDDLYNASWITRGGLPTSKEEYFRMLLLLLVGGTLVSLGLIKIAVALSRGKSNIAFLLLLLGIVGYLTYQISANRGPTTSGRQFLNEMKLLFKRLKTRSVYEGFSYTPKDLSYLGAVFGVSTIPILQLSSIGQLHRKKSNKESGCSTCGSSCGSSCSSCGGGGGCGGCGS